MEDPNERGCRQSAADHDGCLLAELLAVNSNAHAQPPAKPVQIPVPSARILILDDDQIIAELLGELLTVLGHSTVLCHSAPEAL